MRIGLWLLGLLLVSGATQAQARAQTAALDDLTPDQRARFNAAGALFGAEKYAEARTVFAPLLAQLPASSPAYTLVAKYTAECALDTGDRAYALSLLKPIETGDANDWQARSLLARFYAEGGDKPARDAELAALVAQHKAQPQSQIGKLNQVLLERDPLPGGGSVRIWYSLEPYGKFRTYIYSKIFNAAGQQTLSVTLESSDFDQPLWVKSHPELAAKGERMFSMDGYGPQIKNANGTISASHMTFGFFDGQPAYDTVRERILKIAGGAGGAMSRTDTVSAPAGTPPATPPATPPK